MSSTDWPSTKALSVYNALSISGRDMTPDEIGEFLRAEWDPTVDDEYVQTGTQFLLRRGFVRRFENLIVIARHPTTRTARKLVRTDRDADLAYRKA